MKKQLFSILLGGLLLLSLAVLGQNDKYPLTTINGIEYYQYTVEPSEGLLAIGRKFKISAEIISKANPEIEEGLKVGQKILIPVQKKAWKKSVSHNESSPEFIQYKVGKKQTLFSISRKFNVSEEEIVKYNPEIKNGLKEGNILQIPKPMKDHKKKIEEKSHDSNSESSSTDKNKKTSKTITHKVQPDETLFSISKRYKVEITDIIQLNPGSDSKLVVGSDLIIPQKVTSKSKGQKKDSIILESKSTNMENKVTERSTQTKLSDNRPIKIAFLLPFMLDQPKSDPNVEKFIDYYEGSLLAIKAAKKKGISLEIYTYDTEKSEDRVKEILNNPELKSVDLIIGPAFSNQVPEVGNFARENKINTLIPFTSKVADIDSNPYLFQFNPGQESELKFITDLILGKFKNTHVVFAEIQDISPLDDGKARVAALQKKLIKERRIYSTIKLTTADYVNFNGFLKKGEKNLIIFNSDKFSNVSPFINSLSAVSTQFDIVLFEQFNWRNQSDKSPQSIFMSPFITNLNPALVKEFNLQFDQYFGKDVTVDSPRYDLLGYDLTNYFISLIHHNGNKFNNKINSNNIEKGIQSEPLFERDSNDSGFINQRVYFGEDKAQ